MTLLRGLPPGLAGGTNGSIICHSASLRSLGYDFLSIAQYYTPLIVSWQLFRHALSHMRLHGALRLLQQLLDLLPCAGSNVTNHSYHSFRANLLHHLDNTDVLPSSKMRTSRLACEDRCPEYLLYSRNKGIEGDRTQCLCFLQRSCRKYDICNGSPCDCECQCYHDPLFLLQDSLDCGRILYWDP